MKDKIKKIDIPVYIFYFIITFCKGIDLKGENPVYLGLFIFGLILVTTRMIKQKFLLKQVLLMVVSLLIGILIYFVGKNSSPLFLIISLFSLKDVDIKKLLKMIFYVHLVTFILMLFLSSTGIIENVYMMHNRTSIGLSKRYYFGYTHPNLAHMHLLSITILYYYIYLEKSTFINHLFWLTSHIILYNFTYSRTSFYLALLIVICMIFIKNKETLQKKIALLGKYSFILLSMFTIFLTINYKTIPVVKEIDGFLTGRIYYTNYIYENFPITLLGQNDFGKHIYIDNSYFGMLYQSGYIFTLMMLLMNLICTSYLYKNKRWNELIYVFFLNLMCFTENFYLLPTINFIIIVYGQILFDISGKKE